MKSQITSHISSGDPIATATARRIVTELTCPVAKYFTPTMTIIINGIKRNARRF